MPQHHSPPCRLGPTSLSSSSEPAPCGVQIRVLQGAADWVESSLLKEADPAGSEDDGDDLFFWEQQPADEGAASSEPALVGQPLARLLAGQPVRDGLSLLFSSSLLVSFFSRGLMFSLSRFFLGCSWPRAAGCSSTLALPAYWKWWTVTGTGRCS